MHDLKVCALEILAVTIINYINNNVIIHYIKLLLLIIIINF